MAERTERVDVAVVGCGPGGAVLAYLLARSGARVALVEREATFEREYRGFGWNPGVARLFDEMDVLDDVLSLAHETVTEGALVVAGERVPLVDFAALDADYPYLLMLEQPRLLERLVARADAYDGFSVHPATTVTDLRTREDGTVAGVDATDRRADETVAFDASVVVGADGRYSTVRDRAGIDGGRFDSPIDLVWFTLPRDSLAVDAQGHVERAGVLVSFGLGGDAVQVGCPIRDGEWPALREAGFAAFRDRVAAIDPRLGSAMGAHLDGFDDTALLDVAPGLAPTWTRDGLLLLGDAAHTASPIGAQGNPLAVEDAVVAHDVVADALDSGDVSAAALGRFESRRRAHVERVIAVQRRAADALAAWLDHGRAVPDWLLRAAARVAGRALPALPPVRAAAETLALGDRDVRVARSRFADA